jgi:hypothetical protein
MDIQLGRDRIHEIRNPENRIHETRDPENRIHASPLLTKDK